MENLIYWPCWKVSTSIVSGWSTWWLWQAL